MALPLGSLPRLFKDVPSHMREWAIWWNQVITAPRIVHSYTVAEAPSADPAGQTILVTDESGGAVLAFSDGTNWRRVTDRAVIS